MTEWMNESSLNQSAINQTETRFYSATLQAKQNRIKQYYENTNQNRGIIKKLTFSP